MAHTIWPRWKPNQVHPKNRVEDTNVIVLGDSMTRSVHDATSVLKVNKISSIKNCLKCQNLSLEPTRTGFLHIKTTARLGYDLDRTRTLTMITRATLTISGTTRTLRYRLFRFFQVVSTVLVKRVLKRRIRSNQLKILNWALVQLTQFWSMGDSLDPITIFHIISCMEIEISGNSPPCRH